MRKGKCNIPFFIRTRETFVSLIWFDGWHDCQYRVPDAEYKIGAYLVNLGRRHFDSVTIYDVILKRGWVNNNSCKPSSVCKKLLKPFAPGENVVMAAGESR